MIYFLFQICQDSEYAFLGILEIFVMSVFWVYLSRNKKGSIMPGFCIYFSWNTRNFSFLNNILLLLSFCCWLFKPRFVQFLFPHSFFVVTVNWQMEENSNQWIPLRIVYPYLSTAIGKPFLLSKFLFYSSRLSPSVISFLSYPSMVTLSDHHNGHDGCLMWSCDISI